MSSDPTRRGVMLVGLVSCALVVTGCSESASESAPSAPAAADASAPLIVTGEEPDLGAPRWTYEGILGVVSMVPVEGNPAASFKIHHEHIPSFRDPKTGEVVVGASGVTGMRSMSMDMPPADGMDVSGFGVGDRVRFTLGVWTEPRLAWHVLRLEKLDPATEVSFEDKPAP